MSKHFPKLDPKTGRLLPIPNGENNVEQTTE